jgi:hypothetical protein
MDEAKTRDYDRRVTNILKVFSDKYGLEADLVNVNSRTIGTEAYQIMQTILNDRNIALEINDRVAIGKFMFVNRGLVASNAS